MDTYKEIIVIIEDKVTLKYRTDEKYTTVAGIIRNDVLNVQSFDRRINLLIDAFNNRTRERNYFKKYIELLDGEISSEDFDEEIEKNEDLYVVSQNKDATSDEIKQALELSPLLMDVNDIDEMANVFSFSNKSIQKCITKQ